MVEGETWLVLMHLLCVHDVYVQAKADMQCLPQLCAGSSNHRHLLARLLPRSLCAHIDSNPKIQTRYKCCHTHTHTHTLTTRRREESRAAHHHSYLPK